MRHEQRLKDIIQWIDDVEFSEESLLDDKGIDAMIELANARDRILDLIEAVKIARPFVQDAADNVDHVDHELAKAWINENFPQE